MDIQSVSFFQETKEAWLNGHGTLHQDVVLSAALSAEDAKQLVTVINACDPRIGATSYEPNIGGGHSVVYMKRSDIFRQVFPDVAVAQATRWSPTFSSWKLDLPPVYREVVATCSNTG